MSGVTTILLVRHGQSTWNAEGRWQGWADAPLSDLGVLQARAASRHLPDIDAAVSSDLQRAKHTAELLCEGLDLPPIEVVADLRERNVGEFEGLTNPEIAKRFPHLIGRDRSRPLDIPGAEPLADLVERALTGISKIAEGRTGQRVLAVCHGGIIRAIERHLGIDPEHLANLGGRWLEVNEGGRLEIGDRVVLYQPDEAPVTVPRAE